jgi:type 1 glutamine amidotransferase
MHRKTLLASFAAVALLAVFLDAQNGPPNGGRGKSARLGRKTILAWADIKNGVQHDSVSHALATIERLGYESGVYDTYIRTDSQLITKHTVTGSDGQNVRAKNLNDFDAIFFIGLREIDLTAQQREDLMTAIKVDGKGFVAAHTADTAFLSWPEFGEMLGGRYDDHPWQVVEAPVIVEDPDFPAMKHFAPRFLLTDEMYQTKDFSRDRIRVLLRLDTSNLDMKKTGVRRTDGDYPLAWAKMYGKGRVFYSALGHDIASWDNPQLQKMYFEAIKWSLGMTNGDLTPRPMPTAATP